MSRKRVIIGKTVREIEESDAEKVIHEIKTATQKDSAAGEIWWSR